MTFHKRLGSRFHAGMRRRIKDLRAQTETGLDFALEHLFQERVETYLWVEEGFSEIERMMQVIEEELLDVQELTHAQRMESRLEFIEDRFDELDSTMRQRPRRRRHKINLFQFFKTASGGGDPTVSQGEIHSAVQAYEALGLEFGTPMAAVTQAFRQRAKRLHPDSRKGDRTAEPELRRIIEAYQLLKSEFGLS
ncbi:MAG: DnaJ domain-containing protein [Nitrospirales bacterium]|nr:DnaJ domain-containing protein [Nitrospirales bacterium]